MARGQPGIWRRRARRGWYAWINGRQVCLGDVSEREALAAWHRLCGLDPEDNPQSPAKTVASLLAAFLRHLRDSRRRDFGWYQTRILSFGNAIPAALGVDALRPKHVTAWIAANPSWSPTYAAGAIGAVQTALNWHCSEGTLAVNPLARVRKPERRRREFVYTDEQLAALLVALRGAARTFVGLVAATGARPSEIARVCGEDVSSDGATISLRQSKTKRARAIPVPRCWRPRVLRMATEAGGGLLCRQENGGAWHRTAWARAIAAARAEAGLPGDADAYALRHTWITRRIESGESIADVALACGTSIAMISRHYAHLQPERTRSLADRIG
jgi:integrase